LFQLRYTGYGFRYHACDRFSVGTPDVKPTYCIGIIDVLFAKDFSGVYCSKISRPLHLHCFFHTICAAAEIDCCAADSGSLERVSLAATVVCLSTAIYLRLGESGTDNILAQATSHVDCIAYHARIAKAFCMKNFLARMERNALLSNRKQRLAFF